MKTCKVLLLFLCLTLLSVVVASAQEVAPTAKGQAADKTTELTDGLIRKIDRENRKITIKHGEIKNLEMPGMTMVFQVRDPAILDNLKNGDKVQFRAEKVNGAFVVIEMQPVNMNN